MEEGGGGEKRKGREGEGGGGTDVSWLAPKSRNSI